MKNIPMKMIPMKIPTFDGIPKKYFDRIILSIEISKEIAISMSDKAINSSSGFSDAINANMHVYRECLDYDNKGAAESLIRAIQLAVMNLRNKHCI